jgi:hypothetical protein
MPFPSLNQCRYRGGKKETVTRFRRTSTEAGKDSALIYN